MQIFAIILLLGLCVVSDVLAVEETQYSTYEWLKRKLVNMLCRLDSETEPTSLPEVTPVCDNGLTRFDSSCYLFSTEKMTFEEAKSFCDEIGAHIVSIQSKRENDFIKEYLAKLSDAMLFWIGLTDQRNEGEWRWTDTEEEPEFVGWHTGEPNGGSRENCGVVWDMFGYNWNDGSCAGLYRPICEK